LLLAVTSAAAQTPLGSGFTYQGKLDLLGTPVNDTADFEFTLWDADVAGNMIGSVVAVSDVTVINGLFTVELDFGVMAFNGEARWLEIDVRSPAGGGAFTTLDPRQPLTAFPYSLQTRGLFVDDAGNVGLGTTSPAGKLHIASAGQLAIDVGGTTAFFGSFGNPAGQTYGFSKPGVVQLAVDVDSGNVGVGTNTPVERLEVVGNVAADRFLGDGSGLSGVSRVPVDLENVALLRWDRLNRSFPVGSFPEGVAFDGANIWVANDASNNVSKLRASDGANLGTFAVGAFPVGVAFDGANIWVANGTGASVSKLRASDGANLGTFAVGAVPLGVAFDGANIWVANFNSNDVTKLQASDGANLGTFAVGNSPQAVAFDGANIWVSNSGDDNVTKLRASDGAVLGTFAVGSGPVGVAFDGAHIWVMNTNNGNVTKLRASDGALLGTFAVGSGPVGVAFDGANIWVVNSSSNDVTKLRASDGANLGTFPVGGNPRGVAFDGANIWVTNSLDDNVTRISLVK